jgi:hypothetical protein
MASALQEKVTNQAIYSPSQNRMVQKTIGDPNLLQIQ